MSDYSSLSMKAIGRYACDARYKYEQPRQGTCEAAGSGVITLNGGSDFEQALVDLVGFDRIWVIYLFHHNEGTWRPTAAPPVPPAHKKRVGLFSTRSPYRPNPIGLSCVVLEKIAGRTLHISGADLLDETPILDIKPYIPAFDSFPDAAAGWLDEQVRDEYGVVASERCLCQNGWIVELCGLDPVRAAQVQLAINPFDYSRKRVIFDGTTAGIFSYRTWRIHFLVDALSKSIVLEKIRSGYEQCDLVSGADDPYKDKDVHRRFLLHFPEAMDSSTL